MGNLGKIISRIVLCMQTFLINDFRREGWWILISVAGIGNYRIVELGGSCLLVWLQAMLGIALTRQNQAKHTCLLNYYEMHIL